MKKFSLLFLALLLAANNCIAMNSTKRSCNELDNTQTFAEEPTRKRAHDDDHKTNNHISTEQKIKKCSECLDPIDTNEDENSLFLCGHVFHKKCSVLNIKKALICPLCSSNITPQTAELRNQYKNSMINAAMIDAAMIDAAMNNLDGLVEYYLDRQADINAQDNYGITALYYAVYLNSDEKMIKLLLRRGADINIQDNQGKTVLHHAIEENMDDDMIKLLLEHGADINIQDNQGKTPLDLAQLNSDINLPSLLLGTAIRNW